MTAVDKLRAAGMAQWAARAIDMEFALRRDGRK
jgi:hypothetical protein